jgi:hypothetical protein
LNYETDPSCTLSITVSDGKATSDPKTITIDVGNQDEPPVISSSGYVIATKEVVVCLEKNLSGMLNLLLIFCSVLFGGDGVVGIKKVVSTTLHSILQAG